MHAQLMPIGPLAAPLRLFLLSAIMSASSGHRILCLHGSGGSGDAFLARLAHLQEGTARTFHAIDAPSGRRTWWTYPAGERSFTASSYEGAEQSIAAVEAELESGGYVGLLGFSQGAMLAAIVAARASLRESCPLLRFAVICAAAVPKPYEPLLERLRAAPEAAAALPTLHCLSEARARHAVSAAAPRLLISAATLGCTSAVLSAASPCCCTSAAPRLHLGCTSAVS